MFGFERCKDCKKKPVDNYDEFVLQRENDRIKLHVRYICFILVGVIIWLVASGASNNPKFVDWISFASTLTSIILSVLAIIMSITGESKSESARNQLENTTKKIDRAVESMKKINASTEDNISSLRSNINILRAKIDDMDVHIQEFTKEEPNKKVSIKNNFNSYTKWRSTNNE